jgi:transcriptional regulator with XRE-family HTH domain
MTMDPTATPLSGRALEEYGAERIRNDAFEQVRILWDRRRQEGWTQKQLADAIGRDPGWISRNLAAPGNWTLRTIGAFTQGLDGEVDISIYALEDPIETPTNYDAYDGYAPSGVFNIEVNPAYPYTLNFPVDSQSFSILENTP